MLDIVGDYNTLETSKKLTKTKDFFCFLEIYIMENTLSLV